MLRITNCSSLCGGVLELVDKPSVVFFHERNAPSNGRDVLMHTVALTLGRRLECDPTHMMEEAISLSLCSTYGQ
jgi:hypothetical protein